MKDDLKILYTAFNGKNNSSKLLLDKIIGNNKLYLKNSFVTSVKQLEEVLEKENYDLVISFGQAFLNKDTIQIETKGKLEREFGTHYEYEKLKDKIAKKFTVAVSNNAGNYLCNNLYYHGLKFIKEHSLKTNMLFIHIPKLVNITNIEELASVFNDDLYR